MKHWHDFTNISHEQRDSRGESKLTHKPDGEPLNPNALVSSFKSLADFTYEDYCKQHAEVMNTMCAPGTER